MLLFYVVDCFWNPWSDWDDCPVTCGEGAVSRSRTNVVDDDCPGSYCEGDDRETDTCNPRCCPGWLISNL